MADKCGICGTPSKDDLFSAVTREPVCSLCKINYIGGLPTTPGRISDARLALGLVDGKYLVQDRGAEAARILGRKR
jgi:hypothetical protein